MSTTAGKKRRAKAHVDDEDDDDSPAEGEKGTYAYGAPHDTKVTKSSNSNRLSSLKEVADRRAEHFARPSIRSSSTPGGSLRGAQDTSSIGEGVQGEKQHWPGPFSVARQITASAAAIRLRREAEIAQRRAAGKDGAALPEDADEYDIILHSLLTGSGRGANDVSNRCSDGAHGASSSSSSFFSSTSLPNPFLHQPLSMSINTPRDRSSGPPPTLSTLCLAALTALPEHTLTQTLNPARLARLTGVFAQVRLALATELGRQRKMHTHTLALCAPGEAVYLPECSQLNEDTVDTAQPEGLRVSLVKALELASTPAADPTSNPNPASNPNTSRKRTPTPTPHPSPPTPTRALQTLSLGNCGHSVGTKTAEALVRLGNTCPLQVLELRGLYKIADGPLSQVLLAHATSLQVLSLATNCRLSGRGLMAVGGLGGLKSLTLDGCLQITDAELLRLLEGGEGGGRGGAEVGSSSSSGNSSSLFSTALPMLERLSLCGLENITDTAVVPLLEALGERLTHLGLGKCVKITDRAMVAVREHCPRLQALDMSQLHRVSTVGLLGLFLQDTADTSPTLSILESAPAGAGGWTWSLSRVSLQGLVGCTDDVVVALARSCGQTLRKINLGSCYTLSARSIVALGRHCWGLEVVDVSFLREPEEQVIWSPYISSCCMSICVSFEISIHVRISLSIYQSCMSI